ncbi:DinB family protein [Planococcus sp. ISL-109]|uniref:DinB family protein n=1 Tax=Planococcus sp. ISL-109 TaxID=2819166 RepID=UPI001BE517A5|nr:DinB family protein [Planococcus sp. ISL-109]MBT2582941.1 DinB family protein [Planococcus sp. ISL-109]
MNEEMIFRQWKTWRGMIIKLLDKVTEEEADQMPAPFRNSIRWNAGHLVAGIDGFVANSLDTKPFLPERYAELFASGTSPENWQGDVPSLDELKQVLADQPDQIEHVTAGKLDSKLLQPFLGMETLGEVLAFMISHDALHLGTMNAIRKTIKKS